MKLNTYEDHFERAVKLGGLVRTGVIDWPYGAHEVETQARLLKWLETEDLRWVRKGPHYHDGGCFRWVRLGYCRKTECGESTRSFRDFWVDHVSYWRSPDKKRWVLVAQPYQRVEDAIEDTRWIRGEPGIRLEVRGDSWYGHSTVFVGLWGSKR